MDLGVRISLTMASLQDLESFEPLNPLTPDSDFGYFVFSGKLLVNSYLQFLFFAQAIGKFSTRRVPRSVHCWQAVGRLHTTRKIVLTLWFIAENTVVYWGLPCRRRPSSNDFTSRIKPFQKSLRAPMEDKGPKMEL